MEIDSFESTNTFDSASQSKIFSCLWGIKHIFTVKKTQQHLHKRRAVSLVAGHHSLPTHQLPAASLLRDVLRLTLPPPSLSLKLVPMPESLPRSSSRYSSPTSSSSTSASPPTSA